MNFDFVYTPEFDPDRFITGERISYFYRSNSSLAGKSQIIRPDYPDDETIAIRAHRLWASAELSIYYNNGRWTQPLGFNPDTDQAIFPRLETFGASWRQPFAGGICISKQVNMEVWTIRMEIIRISRIPRQEGSSDTRKS